MIIKCAFSDRKIKPYNFSDFGEAAVCDLNNIFSGGCAGYFVKNLKRF